MQVSLVASMQTQSETFITPQAAATVSGLLGFDATSLAHLDLGISCHYSLQILSSVVRILQEGIRTLNSALKQSPIGSLTKSFSPQVARLPEELWLFQTSSR